MPPKPGDHILVEFMDYQCPSCARMEREALSGKLLDSLGVRRIIRHFPLPYHAQALTAAASTECVRRQTGTTATVHALLLQQQDSLGKVPWTTFALNSGAHDTSAFNRCIEDTAVALQIQRDIALGKDVGLSGTPAFYLDGVQVPALLPSQFAAYLSSPKTRLGLGDVGTAIKSFF